MYFMRRPSGCKKEKKREMKPKRWGIWDSPFKAWAAEMSRVLMVRTCACVRACVRAVCVCVCECVLADGEG